MNAASRKSHPFLGSSGRPTRRSYPPSLACGVVEDRCFHHLPSPNWEKPAFGYRLSSPRGLQGGMRDLAMHAILVRP